MKRSLGALSILADWGVRVFGLSGLIDKYSYNMYVRTITLSESMNRRSCYTNSCEVLTWVVVGCSLFPLCPLRSKLQYWQTLHHRHSHISSINSPESGGNTNF